VLQGKLVFMAFISPGVGSRLGRGLLVALCALLLALSACYVPNQPGGGGSPFTPPAADDDDSAALGGDDDDSASLGGDDDDSTALDDDDSATGNAGDDDSAAAEIVLAPPAACPCGFGQICVAGLCQYVNTFAVGLLEAAHSLDSEIPSGMACFWNPAFIGSVVAREGDCYVRVLSIESPPEPHVELDGGWVTVTGGQIDPIQFSQSGPATCMNSNIIPGVTNLFEQGDVLQFSSGGGNDLPAFTATLQAPAPIEGSPGTIEIGQPVTMAWNGAASDFVELTLSTEDSDTGYAYAAVCRVADSGSAIIPATITAFLPEAHGDWEVSFSRNEVDHLEYTFDALVVEVVVQTSWATAVSVP